MVRNKRQKRGSRRGNNRFFGHRRNDDGSGDNNRRDKHHGSGSDLVMNNDLEEDLRQQRLRQQERQKLRDQQESDDQLAAAEQQREEQQDATPAAETDSDPNNNQFRVIHRGGIYSYADVTKVHSLSFAYAQQAAAATSTVVSHHRDPTNSTTSSDSITRQALLRHVWYGRYMLEQTSLYSEPYKLYYNPRQYKWNSTRLYQLPHGMYAPWDLTCKYHVPSFARTFDVANMMTSTVVHGSTNNDDTEDSIVRNHRSRPLCLPTIVSAVQGGILLCQQPGGEQEELPQHAGGRRLQQRPSSSRASSSTSPCCTPRMQNIRGEPVHSVRLYSPSSSSSNSLGYVGTLTQFGPQRGYNSSSQKLKLYDLQHGQPFWNETLPLPMNDFCFGQDLVLFAPSLSSSPPSNNDRLTPLFLAFRNEGGGHGDPSSTNNFHPNYTSSSLRTLPVDNFPQSDAIRVEIHCSEKLVSFGHRNGQVSLIDLRQSTTCCGRTDIPRDQQNPSSTIGSATDLILRPSQHQLVVKHAFGRCQVHDLRRLSSTSTQDSATARQPLQNRFGGNRRRRVRGNNNEVSIKDFSPHHYSSDSSLLFHLSVPERYNCHPNRSSRANGLAMLDQASSTPCHSQVVIAPFVNTSNESCLGYWSLRNGMFLGQKPLHSSVRGSTQGSNSNSSNRTEDDCVVFTELCQTVTPAYYFNEERSNSKPPRRQNHPHSSSSTTSSGLGVWVKFGHFTKADASIVPNSKTGSLRHITFPGKWE